MGGWRHYLGMGEGRDPIDNHANLLGIAGPSLEGWWRGGFAGSSGAGGAFRAPGQQVNAEMLERFAGVSGGGSGEVFHGAPNGGGVNALGVLGTLGSAYGMVTGAMDMCDDTKSPTARAIGGVSSATGAVGTAGGLANMIGVAPTAAPGLLGGAQNVLAGMTSLGGAGIGGGGLAGEAFAASTWFGTAAGGAGAGTAVGTGAALGTGAAVLGAGLGGLGIGAYGDDHMKQLDLLDHRSISDWGADQAVAAEDAVGGWIGGEQGSLQRSIGRGVGHGAGALTSLGTSLLGVPLAVGSAIDGAEASLFDLAGAGIDKLRQW